MSDYSILRAAEVSFHTNDDDKDEDTHITVTVRNRDSIIVARIDNDFGNFNKHSDNGPFNLSVVNQVAKSTIETGGSVTIRIDPNGDDTWTFNFMLQLSFADGSRLNANADGIALSDESQQQTFPIH